LNGRFWFGTSPLAADSCIAAQRIERECAIGCFLDLDATPARMTVFVDGEPVAVQCEYDFPTDRAWYPSVALWRSAGNVNPALHSCAM
jgi:hypothetical protein